MADSESSNKRSGKQSRSRPPREGGPSARGVTISKALSYVLRHGADKEGIALDKQGYANVDDLLKWNRLRSLKTTLEDIEQVVKEDAKQRYNMTVKPSSADIEATDFTEPKDASKYLIRANQGHSLKIESEELLTLLTETTVPNEPVIHGAFYGSWGAILSSGGLSRMNRQHMHFSRGLPGEDGVLSGFRGDAQLLVYVDAARALADGINFWESANHVILTEGDSNGFLPLRYFSRVVDRKGDLGVIWQDGAAIKELPPHLKNKKPPQGKRGDNRKNGKEQQTVGESSQAGGT